MVTDDAAPSPSRAPDRGLLAVPADRRGRRLGQLAVGLALYGVSLALMLRAELGLDPWDVFHQGLSERMDLGIGWIVIGVGVAVLLLWIPLRERPGLGTVANALAVGLVVEAALWVLPDLDALAVRVPVMVGGIVGTALATSLYIGAGLGPGPRDGLMTGLARRGGSVRVVRTGIEVAVLATGWLLGGSVGVATVLFAVAIGPLVHVLLPRCTVGTPAAPGPPPEVAVLPEPG